MRRLHGLPLVLVAAGAMAVARAEDLGFQVPPGFEVTLFAGDELAHDIYSMTIDSLGRVVVAGRNYVKVLHDDNGDGKADKATLFSAIPASGAHGMYFDGPDLICTGDNSLMRLRDTNGDGVADGPPEKLAELRHPEHGANGVVKGPDGWYYVICGNDAGVSEKHVTTPNSPVKKPNCGAVVRISPDGKQSEVFAHGFRNPYDLDFNARGHLFTVDADGERDQYLPWYAPNRLFDIAQGMHHGWLITGWTRSWNRPAYFFDNVPRLVEIGRGSPTGLVVYRHRQFPEHYRGGVFSACWTFGRIYYFPLTPSGASYQSKLETFMETTGNVGFAPTDLAVGPAGDLFVAIGGRGTRGSVFRVRYKAGHPVKPIEGDALAQVLQADQPLSSWSRARWGPLATALPREQLLAALDARDDGKRHTTLESVRAVEVLTEYFGGITPTELAKLIAVDPETAARAAWSGGEWMRKVSVRPQEKVSELRVAVRRLLDNPQHSVQRAAWDAVAAAPALKTSTVDDYFLRQIHPSAFESAILSADRRLAAAAIGGGASLMRMESRVAAIPDYASALQLDARPAAVVRRSGDEWERITLALCKGAIFQGTAPPLARLASLCREAVARSRASDVHLDAIRLLQIAFGDLRTAQGQLDLYTGYAPAASDEVHRDVEISKWLRSLLSSPDERVAWEAARTLAMIASNDDEVPLSIALCLSNKQSPQADIHFLIVLSRVGGARSGVVTRLTSIALAGLHGKMDAARYEASRNWGIVVSEVFEQLCQRDPALAETLVAEKEFGRPEHALFAAKMTGETRVKAARKIFDAAVAGGEKTKWTAELIEMAALLPTGDVRPKLRELWNDEPGLRDPIALSLAVSPEPTDRTKFVTALGSPQAPVIVAVAKALTKLGGKGAEADIALALRSLREYTAAKQHADVRRALVELLKTWTGQSFAIDESKGDLRTAYQPWFDWFAKTHPGAMDLVAGNPGDATNWPARLAKVNWLAGDAVRGRKVFEARTCHRCHGNAGKLGPDLNGVASRFARDDLFTTIVDPNRDVSPLYQTTQVTTRTGQTHVGLLVYESPESTLVQTGPDTTLRITDEDLSQRRPSRQSLMPTGLLNGVSDAELADLYAYLRSLK